MRLPDEIRITAASLIGLGWALGAAPVFAHHPPPAPALPEGAPPGVTGPAADYPVVVGEPYRVGATVFTPVNVMNYDAVGYASVGGQGTGIFAAHHTLPLPCYVEVTALASGRTILVRVDRRGPMDGTHAIELSPAAAQALGVGNDAPVRLRRVNPLESDRALLRLGQSAPERMPTPKSLLAVLERRLASDPAATHAGASLARGPMVEEAAPIKPPPRAAIKRTTPPAGASFAQAEPIAAPEPLAKPPKVPVVKPAPSATLVVQIGAFGEKPRAAAIAARIHGQLAPVGKLWRVRTGPYSSPAQAEAALAKAKAAGYTDARIQRAK